MTQVLWRASAPARRRSSVLRTFYVSNSGSDAADGLTTSTPWQTFSKLNSATLLAGDAVLFNGGQTFTTSAQAAFDSSDGGTVLNPLTIGSYGTGKATISVTGANGFNVYNRGNIVIRDLNITGISAMAFDGITFYADTAGNVKYPGVVIDNCTITGFRFGIALGGGNVATGFDTPTITNNTTHGCRDIGIITYGPTFVPGTPTYAHSNCVVRGNLSHSNLGNSANTTNHTGNGIIIAGCTGGIMEYNTAYGNGTLCAATTEGPAGIWVYNATGITLQYNLAYSNRAGTDPDGDGFDLDINTSNCIVQYNLAYDNDGAGLLIFTGQANDSHTGNIARFNVFYRNSRKNDWYGEVKVAGRVNSCQVYNNTMITNPNAVSGNPPCISVEGTEVTGLTVRNNAFAQVGTVAGCVETETAGVTTSDALFQGNGYQSAGPIVRWNNTNYTTLAAWRAAVAGQEVAASVNRGYVGSLGLTSTTTAPTVTVPANLATYTSAQLANGSAAIGAGLDLASLFSVDPGTLDYYGNTLATPLSIGAHDRV